MPKTTPIEPTLPATADVRGPGGLLALAGESSLVFPLLELRVRAAIAGDCCRTVVEQRFANALDRALEAVHLFPLPVGGAVVALRLVCGDVTVDAECRERQDAERTFDQARASGHRAALLLAERDDVHTLRVTRIPPGEEVRVRIVVVERLAFVDGRWRWRWPTVIAPRYLPGTPVGHEGPGALPDTDHAPDASRLQPPLRLAGGTRLDLEVQVEGPIGRVASSLHAVSLELEDHGVRVAPSGTATCDRDFVLGIWPRAQPRPAVRAFTDGQHTAVFVEPPAGSPACLPRDAVFVIDVSGSMQGAKLEAARRALAAALHGLSEGDRFRLISFSDDLDEFAKGYTDYGQAALESADAWIARLQTRGGTEMLPAVVAALSSTRTAGRVATVLFITDGEVHNDAELVAAVAHRANGTRFYTLGIDPAVNAALLTRMARVGGGSCELATPADDVEEVIVRLEARLGGPVADELAVTGIEPADPAPGVLFAGLPRAVIGTGSPERVFVSYRTVDGPASLEVVPSRVAWPLGVFWARERVAMLEDRIAMRPFEAEAIRPEILRIALAHAIASRHTAFVAVERTRVVGGELAEIVQPVELPSQWEESPVEQKLFSALFGSAVSMDCMTMGDLDVSARVRSAGKQRSTGRAKSRRSAPKLAKASYAAAPLALPQEGSVPAARPADPAGELARSQAADGSFGGDLRRTAAALVALVLLGSTRQAGGRRRTVDKAARWLAKRAEPLAQVVLTWLEAVESGTAPPLDPALGALVDAEREGAILGAYLEASA